MRNAGRDARPQGDRTCVGFSKALSGGDPELRCSPRGARGGARRRGRRADHRPRHATAASRRAAPRSRRRPDDRHRPPRRLHPDRPRRGRQRLPVPRHQPDAEQLGLPGHVRPGARERRLCRRVPDQRQVPGQPVERHPPGTRPARRLPLRGRGREVRRRLHRLPVPRPGQGAGRAAQRVPGSRPQGVLHHRPGEAAGRLLLLAQLLRPLRRRLLRGGRRGRDLAARLHGHRPPRPPVDRAQRVLRHARLPVVRGRPAARDLRRHHRSPSASTERTSASATARRWWTAPMAASASADSGRCSQSAEPSDAAARAPGRAPAPTPLSSRRAGSPAPPSGRSR